MEECRQCLIQFCTFQCNLHVKQSCRRHGKAIEKTKSICEVSNVARKWNQQSRFVSLTVMLILRFVCRQIRLEILSPRGIGLIWYRVQSVANPRLNIPTFYLYTSVGLSVRRDDLVPGHFVPTVSPGGSVDNSFWLWLGCERRARRHNLIKSRASNKLQRIWCSCGQNGPRLQGTMRKPRGGTMPRHERIFR